MLWIACVDDKGGMMFGGRRQSKDRRLIEHMLCLLKDTPLWMSPYSATQFEGAAVHVDEAYAAHMAPDDACFIEDGVFPDELPDAVILYRWNRRYPADRFFPADLLDKSFRLVSSEDFVGFSHDTITVDRYERNEAYAL